MDERQELQPGEGRPMSLLAAAMWTLTVSLVAAIGVSLAESARPTASSDLVTVTACILLAYAIVTFGVLRVHEPHSRVRDVVAARPVSIVGLVLAPLVGAGMHPALATIDAAIDARFPLTEKETELLDQLTRIDSSSRRLFLVVSLGVLVPVVDELFFRGVIYGGLRRGRTIRVGIVGAAILFASAHGDPRAFPAALAFGLVLTWLRARSGSVWTSIVAHVAYYAVPLAPVALGREGPESYSRAIVGGGVALAAVSLALSAWIFDRDPRAEVYRAEDAA